MGYTTRFVGTFTIEPQLTLDHYNELRAICDDDATATLMARTQQEGGEVA